MGHKELTKQVRDFTDEKSGEGYKQTDFQAIGIIH